MNIWDYDKLLLFIAFVIPGFISMKSYELIFPDIQKDSSKRLIDAITYSSINYALLLWCIILVENSEYFKIHNILHALFYSFVLFVAPVIWTCIWGKLRVSQIFQKNVPHPTQKPWDHVFSQRKSYWIKVTLRDGKKIGGLFSSKSFASSAPAEEQIYLEQSWIINEKGGFERVKNKSAGVMVMSSDISYLEFINL